MSITDEDAAKIAKAILNAQNVLPDIVKAELVDYPGMRFIYPLMPGNPVNALVLEWAIENGVITLQIKHQAYGIQWERILR